MTAVMEPLDGAIFWLDRSFSPVPVRFKSKKPYNPNDPGGQNWQGLRITKETANLYFNGNQQNIGVLLGDRFGSTDIDLDCREAILLAPLFLPETRLKFGRSSKACSHWFYRIDPPVRTEKFTDPISRRTLLELRCRTKDNSIGLQTVVPPSIHESGERIRFEPGCDGYPANVDADDLQLAVKLVASAALLVRHWPAAGEGRHETMLALAGVLQRAGWTEEAAVRFCLAVYRTIPDHDHNAIARTEREVRDTFCKATAGGATTGVPSLRLHLDGRVVRQVLAWLQIDRALDGDTDGVIRNKSGEPKPILANAVTVLRTYQEWRGVLAFDEFARLVVAVKPTPWGRVGTWTDHDDRAATDYLQRTYGLNLQIHVVAEAVQLVARENGFDPLLEYLDGLRWDGTPRIDRWLAVYLGAKATPYTAAVGSRWLISAVARARQPACKADCVLILEGKQGIGKSEALRIIAEPWFTDEIAELGSKDAAMQLLGVWIIEIAELDSMSRADVSRVKAFISRSTDRFRLPYGRRVQDQPRRCVFAGTVNASDYLRDDTGNRRFWPVACSVVRLEELRRDRDQLWAEAVHRFREEERWWLDDVALVADAEQEQAARVPPDPWQERIEKYLAGRDDVSTTEILTDCIGKPVENQQRRDEMRVGAVLRSLKWQRYREPRFGPASSRPRRYRRIEV